MCVWGGGGRQECNYIRREREREREREKIKAFLMFLKDRILILPPPPKKKKKN